MAFVNATGASKTPQAYYPVYKPVRLQGISPLAAYMAAVAVAFVAIGGLALVSVV